MVNEFVTDLQIGDFIAQFCQIINTSEYAARGSAKGSSVTLHHGIPMVVVQEGWALPLTSLFKKSKEMFPRKLSRLHVLPATLSR
jgi:hypothetical protein